MVAVHVVIMSCESTCPFADLTTQGTLKIARMFVAGHRVLSG
jgi:hypothetical protein